MTFYVKCDLIQKNKYILHRMYNLLVMRLWVIFIFLFILSSIIFKNVFLEQRIFVSQLIASGIFSRCLRKTSLKNMIILSSREIEALKIVIFPRNFHILITENYICVKGNEMAEWDVFYARVNKYQEGWPLE